MSARKTNIIHITTSSGMYENFGAALKDANALKIKLKRLCGAKSYACLAIIGVSQHCGKIGSVQPKKLQTGRGRPHKVFTGSETTAPHLHIILLGCPCDTLRKEIQAFFNGKATMRGRAYQGNVNITSVSNTKCLVAYVLRQSSAIRTVEVNPESSINSTNDFGLSRTLEEVESAHKIIFTSIRTVTEPSLCILSSTMAKQVSAKNSQCNNTNKSEDTNHPCGDSCLCSSAEEGSKKCKSTNTCHPCRPP